MIVITCRDEKHQVELLERFQGERLQCKAQVGYSIQPNVEMQQNGAGLVGVLDQLKDEEPERFEALNQEVGRWLAACGVVTPPRAIAQEWVRTWGLDLSLVEEDRDARNLASYRPSEFRRPAPIAVSQTLEFIETLWKLFEPGEPTRFPYLERCLLRRALHGAGINAPIAGDIETLGIATAQANEWAGFLGSVVHPVPLVEAEEKSSIEQPRCHLQVISRGALLLYLATAGASRHLRNAGYSRQDLAFWWQPFGERHALWGTDQIPANPRDLWRDIEDSLNSCQTWRLGANPPSLRAWRRMQPNILDDFGACDLIGIWGLTP